MDRVTFGRTPRPADSHKFVARLSAEDADYVRALLDAQPGKSATEIVHREFDFLRTWGLTRSRLPRLLLAAKPYGSPLEYVQALITRFVFALPLVAVPPLRAVPADEKEKHTLGLILNGPTYALMLTYSKQHDVSVHQAFSDLFTWARTHGQTRPHFSALQAHAAAKRVTPRDLVLDLIADHVAQLPDAAPEAEQPQPRRRTQR